MKRNSEKMKTAVLTLCLFFLCAAAFPQVDGQASENEGSLVETPQLCAGTNEQLFLILRQLESKLNNAEKQLADLKSSIQGKNITQLEVFILTCIDFYQCTDTGSGFVVVKPNK